MERSAREQATRRRILAAATEVFLERGFEGASMDAIQRRAGGSKATLYAHFPGKEALFAAILADLEQGPLSLEALRLDGKAARPLLEAVGLKVLQAACSPWYSRLQRRVLERAEAAPEQAANFFAAGPGRSLDTLAALLARLHREGRLRCPRPQPAAVLFLGQVQGWHGLRALYGVGVPPALAQRAWVRACVRDFLRLHGPGPLPGRHR